jgi:P-type conjugative transfer protein TrbL
MKSRDFYWLFLLGFLVAFCNVGEAAVNASGVLTDVKSTFQRLTESAAGPILASARSLFFSLAVISLAWDFGFLALRQADFSEFVISLMRFVLPLGLFLYFLENGPTLGKAILQGFLRLGGQASGTGITEPSQLVQYGFDLMNKALESSTLTSLPTSIAALVLAFAAYLLLLLIAGNYLVQLCAGWIVLYGGCFLLGFGGASITRELAIQYFRTLLGIGLGLLTMILLMGIAGAVLSQYIANMSGPLLLHELAVAAGVIVLLYQLVDKLPAVMGGMVSHTLGHSGIGRHGVGSLVAGAETMGTGLKYGWKGVKGAGNPWGRRGNSQADKPSALTERLRLGQQAAAASNRTARPEGGKQ